MLTIQEMFNRAYIGLRSQNWEQCIGPNKNHTGDMRFQSQACVYSDGKGKHCAWGWVDPELENYGVSVTNLSVGVAAFLTPEQRVFAEGLQDAHDSATSAEDMQQRMTDVAKNYDLEIPD